MTTDRRVRSHRLSVMPTLGRAMGTLVGLAIFWFLLTAFFMWIGITSSTALVIVPSELFVSRLSSDMSLMRSSEHVLTVYSEQPGYVVELYRAGAILVLPGRKSGYYGAKPP